MVQRLEITRHYSHILSRVIDKDMFLCHVLPCSSVVTKSTVVRFLARVCPYVFPHVVPVAHGDVTERTLEPICDLRFLVEVE